MDFNGYLINRDSTTISFQKNQVCAYQQAFQGIYEKGWINNSNGKLHYNHLIKKQSMCSLLIHNITITHSFSPPLLIAYPLALSNIPPPPRLLNLIFRNHLFHLLPIFFHFNIKSIKLRNRFSSIYSLTLFNNKLFEIRKWGRGGCQILCPPYPSSYFWFNLFWRLLWKRERSFYCNIKCQSTTSVLIGFESYLILCASSVAFQWFYMECLYSV